MIDVLLIRPKYSMPHSMIFSYSCKKKSMLKQLCQPLNLCYLASMLQKRDISVEIMDCLAPKFNQKKLIDIIKAKKPNLIGIYVSSFSLVEVNNLIKEIRTVSHSSIVLGGPHITHHPQSVSLLKADYGIGGDGEYSLTKLADFILKNKRPLEDIPGIVYIKDRKLKMKKPIFVKNLDDLPFPNFDLLGDTQYFSPPAHGKFVVMVTSRGCPFDCVYCGLPYKKKRSSRSLKNIMSELKSRVKQGYEFVDFRDECFTYDKKRIYELCKLMIKENLNVKWGCETRADFMDHDLLKIMKKAGCQNIKFGIESGSERIRKIGGKNISNNQIKKIFKYMKRLGIYSIAFFLLGNPGETLDDMKATADFIKKIKPDYMDLMPIIPIPGSRIFEIAVKEGKINKNIWDGIIKGKQIPIYIPDNVKLSDMLNLQRKIHLEFYLNPKNILKNIFNIKNFSDIIFRIDMVKELIGIIKCKNKKFCL